MGVAKADSLGPEIARALALVADGESVKAIDIDLHTHLNETTQATVRFHLNEAQIARILKLSEKL